MSWKDWSFDISHGLPGETVPNEIRYCRYRLATEYDNRGPIRHFWIADES